MSVLALVLLAIVAAGLLGVLATVTFSVRGAKRAVRLVPRLPTTAPVSWLWRPQRPAQLHRRLRRTCRSVVAVLGPIPRRDRRWLRRAEPAASPLFSAAEELIDASDHLDRQLVVIGRLPRHWHRRVDGELIATVGRLEQVGERLVQVSLAWQRHVTDATPSSWPPVGRGWNGDGSGADGSAASGGSTPLAALAPGRVDGLADRLTALEQALRDLRLLVTPTTTPQKPESGRQGLGTRHCPTAMQ